MIRWRDIELLIVCVFIILTIIAFLQDYLNIRFSGANLLNIRLWAYFTIGVIALSDVKVFLSRPMLICYLLLVVFFGLSSLRHYDLEGVYYRKYYVLETQILPFIVAILLNERFLKAERAPQLRIILIVGVIAYLLESVLSIYLIYRFPDAVRGTAFQYTRETIATYERMGLGDYSLVSSLPFLIVPLVSFFRAENRIFGFKKVTWLFCLSLILFYSYKAVLVGPFLVAMVAFFLAMLGRVRVLGNMKFMLTIALFFMFIPRVWIGDFFYALSEAMPNQELKTKLSDLGLSFSQGIELESDINTSNEIESRASRIPLTLGEFVKNPLIGTGKVANSHVYWFNYLAQFGLLAFLPLFFALYVQTRRKMKVLDQDNRFYYGLTIVSFAVLGVIKAYSGFPIFITGIFLGPALIYYNSLNQQEVHAPVPALTQLSEIGQARALPVN